VDVKDLVAEMEATKRKNNPPSRMKYVDRMRNEREGARVGRG
jgi:hypothetical protein